MLEDCPVSRLHSYSEKWHETSRSPPEQNSPHPTCAHELYDQISAHFRRLVPPTQGMKCNPKYMNVPSYLPPVGCLAIQNTCFDVE